MSAAVERPLRSGPWLADATTADDRGLEIIVIFTTVDATVAALKKAGALAGNLRARITLISPQIVPYPLPLSSPPVLLDFQEKRFREIAAQSSVEIRVQLYLCRDEIETLESVLKPDGIIVIGGRRRWWPTREQRLARKLQKRHQVIFAEPD